MKRETVCVLAVTVMSFTSCWSTYDTGLCVPTVYEKTSNFDMNRLFGSWYENATYSRLMGKTGYCGRLELPEQSGDDFEFYYTEFSRFRRRKKTRTGRLIKYRAGLNHFKYQLTIGKVTTSMKLMDTDYTCWAVMHFCWDEKDSLFNIHKDYISVFLRSKKPECLNTATDKAVNEVLKHEGLKLAKFDYSDHSNC